MSSDLSEDELYSEEEEVYSDQLDPIPDESLIRSLWVCNPIVFNLRYRDRDDFFKFTKSL